MNKLEKDKVATGSLAYTKLLALHNFFPECQNDVYRWASSDCNKRIESTAQIDRTLLSEEGNIWNAKLNQIYLDYENFLERKYF